MLYSLAKARRKATGVPGHVPAPIFGWNARDSIADMDPRFAILADNWWPTPSDVALRQGWDAHVTDISGQVESLMVYNNPNGTETLFCAAGTAFYDVTTAGAVGAAVQSALTNARWFDTNFTTTAATYLIACNGADSPRYWDGSAWVAVTGVSTPAITGVTTTTLIFPWAHKNRMFFVQKDTLTVWYLGADAVGGAATAFRLNGVAKKGGYIVAGGTWTIDAGEGVDDHWVAITSEGEVIVYKGTDISSASTWTLVGVWSLGQPIGRRCLIKYRGDLLLILKDGVFPLSKALLSATVDRAVALTDNIGPAMSEAATLYGTNFGWQLLHYPKADMLLLNVPISEGWAQQQYVMNTQGTNPWARFKSITANCWAIHNGIAYFGGNGVVGEFWNADLDDNGNDIDADMKQAFNYFKTGNLKRWTAARPIIATNGTPAIAIGLNVDYSDDDPTGTLSFTPTTYAVWDSSLWDVGIWGGGLSVSRQWQNVSGVGFCAALRLKASCQGIEVRLQAVDYLMEPGGIIG